MSYNTVTIRELLKVIFDDQELIIFCYDSFRPVYDKFASEMSRLWKIQLLIDYCEKYDQFDELLTQVRDINPEQYIKFIPSIKGSPKTSTVGISASKNQVEITLKGDLPNFTPELQFAAIGALAGVLNISRDQISVLRVQAGSIILHLEMPTEAVNQLVTLYEANNPIMQDLGIQQVNLIQGQTSQTAASISSLHGKSHRVTTIQDFYQNFEQSVVSGVLDLAETYLDQPHELTGEDFRNIATSIEWSYANQQWQQVLDFIPPLSNFFEQQAFWTEGIYLIELALQATDFVTDGAHQRPQLYFWLGLLYDRQGQLAEAEQYYQTGAKLAFQSGQRNVLADAYHRLGGVAHSRREYAKAKGFYEEARSIRETLHPSDDRDLTLSRSWHQLGILEQDLGHYDVACSNHQKALDLRRKQQADYLIAASLHQLGALAIEQQEWQQAEDHLQEALTIRRSINDRDGQAQALDQLGVIAQRQGRLDEAYASYEESLRLKEQLKDAAGVIHAQMHLGEICLAQEKWEVARNLFEGCLTQSQSLAEPYFEAHASLQLGFLALLLLDLEQADHYYQRSYDLIAKLDNTKHEQAGILYQLGLIAFEQSQFSNALKRYQKSLDIQEHAGFALEAARTHLQLGMVYQAQDMYDRARQHYEKSYALLTKEGGDIADQAQAIYRLGNIAELSKQPQKALEYYRQAEALRQSHKLPDMEGIPTALERVKNYLHK